MTNPCTKEDAINFLVDNAKKTDQKLDTLIELQVDNAALHAEQSAQRATIDDHETRIRRVERTPIRLFWWIAGLGGTVFTAWITHSLWG